MKNIKLIRKIISSLNKRLFDKKDKLYNLHYNIKNKKVNKLRTTFVEAHCINCLFNLGYKKQAIDMTKAILKSNLFYNSKYLFRFSMKNNKIINPDKNGCANFSMIINLAEFGLKKEANRVMDSIFLELFDNKTGLFGRSTRDKKLLVMQTNLWAYLALKKMRKSKEADLLLKNIIKRFYNKKIGLFSSSSSTQEGKHGYEFVFCDDNLLFCWIADKVYPKLCKQIAKRILETDLFDKEKNLFNRSIRLNDNFLNTEKSVYKNSICLLGLKNLKSLVARELQESMVKNLYNKKENLFFDCFADSNLLACLALSK